MPSDALASCLVGLSPPEWYAMINARVFFWIDPDRLNRQRAACGARPQIVLTVDTQQLVTAYHDRISVTAINTGNARRRPAQRGAATFVPYQEWLAARWSSESRGLGMHERSRSHRPVELTVLESVPDIMRFIVGTRRLEPGELLAPGD